MSITIGLFEAKTNLSRLAQEVERGQTIIVTKNGTPMFEMRPIQKSAKETLTAFKEMRQGLKGVTLAGLDIKELIEEGRA